MVKISNPFERRTAKPMRRQNPATGWNPRVNGRQAGARQGLKAEKMQGPV